MPRYRAALSLIFGSALALACSREAPKPAAVAAVDAAPAPSATPGTPADAQSPPAADAEAASTSATEADASAVAQAPPDVEPVAEPTEVPEDEPNTTLPERWWDNAAEHCPEGSTLQGAVPPEGTGVGCRHPERGSVGASTRFFPASKGAGRSSEGVYGPKPEGRGVVPVGLWRDFHPDGSISKERRYDEQGRMHGRQRFFRPDGTVLGEVILIHGTGVSRTWHENGAVRVEGSMRDGKRVGVWNSFADAGVLRRVEHYDDEGQPHGPLLAYDEDGKPKLEGQHVHGKEDGTWTYYMDGVISRTLTHDPVNPDRETIIYYQDGKPLGGPAPACTPAPDVPEPIRLALTGSEPRKAMRCVDFPSAFPGLMIVGSFAHDRGCRPTGYVLDCVVHETLPTAAILERVGWKEANAENREAIAERYTEKVHTAMKGSISRDDEATYTRTSDGGVRVKARLRKPSGMRREPSFASVSFTLSPDGELK